jgi:hypothetical protein
MPYLPSTIARYCTPDQIAAFSNADPWQVVRSSADVIAHGELARDC